MLRNLLKLSLKSCKSQMLMATNKLPKLEWMVYEVTDACNSRCKHCNIWKLKPTRNLLTPKEIEKVFSDKFFSDLKYIIITGGEPFIRKDLEDVILSIHKVLPNTRMTLSTNGLLPQRVIDIVKNILNYDLCFDVGVSLDGIGEIHDSIRGMDGNFEKVDNLLQELSKLRNGKEDKFTVTVAHTLSHLTVDTMMDTARYAKKLNLGFLTQLCEEFSYYDNFANVGQSENHKQINAINQLPPSIHNELLIKSLRFNKPVKFRCFSMRTFFLLRSNGDITPCIRYSNHRVGNVRDSSATEILESQRANEEREIINNCEGCSNTWASSWSYNEWLPSFIDIVVRYKMKTFFNNTNSKEN